MTTRYFRNILSEVGFTDEQKPIAVAIAAAESSKYVDMTGDVILQTDVWGPSIGLFQVRSLKQEFGKGTSRDAMYLDDPVFNTRAAYEISSKGTNWTPWSVYNDDTYKKYLSPGGTTPIFDFIVTYGLPARAKYLLEQVPGLVSELKAVNNRLVTLAASTCNKADVSAILADIEDVKLAIKSPEELAAQVVQAIKTMDAGVQQSIISKLGS